MIIDQSGRSRSKRTTKEIDALLQKEMAALTEDERIALQALLTRVSTSEAVEFLAKAEYKYAPVDLRTFVTDPYYLGNTCDNIYPKLMADLEGLFDGTHNECILTGAIGWGKSHFASIGACRILYELSCMRSPHTSFGLSPGSNISLVMLSVSEQLAVKVVFESIATKIRASPYFQENFPFEVTKKELRFPGNVWVAARASTDTSVLGLNVFGAVLDECLPEDALVLQGNGEEVLVRDLSLGRPFDVVTFDFSAGKYVVATAVMKKSTEQEVLEASLDNGTVLRASWNHPVAVRRGDRYEFILFRDILPEEEVVCFGEERDDAECRNAAEDRESDAGSGVFRGDAKADERGCEKENSRRSRSSSPSPDVGEEKPDVREASVGRGQAKALQSEQGEKAHGRGASEDVRVPSREEGSLRGVQETVVREESDAGVSAHRGVEAEDLPFQRVASAERRLSVQGVRPDREGGAYRVQEPVGTSGGGVAGSRSEGRTGGVRNAGSSLQASREVSLDASRLSGVDDGRDAEGHRSEAEGVHLQREGTGEDGGRSRILRGARLGLRGLGRTLSLARVVSKRSVGVQSTYDICVPGYECFVANGVLVHNTNFMHQKKVKISSSHSFKYDRAETLYNALQRRMKSRFERYGRLPGILFVVSSKKTTEDFTSRRIKESKTDPAVFVRDYALWDVRPEDYYKSERFWVLCGNEKTPSRVLPKEENVEELRKSLPEDVVLIDVPEDFRLDFERDLEGSIRDIAGVSTVAVSPFITRREKIEEAVDQGRVHPFTVEVLDPSKGGGFRWEVLSESVDARLRDGSFERVIRPRINPRAPRHIHIDPSLTGDATGFVMAHVSKYAEVQRKGAGGEIYHERAPVFTVDVALRIIPPSGDEIILSDVRKLVYELTAHGFNISMITMDRFQSADMIQRLSQKGYNTEILSVDMKMDPYDVLKQALYENRVHLYQYKPLLDELRTLERDLVKGKVDHPTNGSKDIADALAGACFTLSQKTFREPLPILPTSAFPQGEMWMSEQRHADLAGQRGADVNRTIVPPFLGGGMLDDWESRFFK